MLSAPSTALLDRDGLKARGMAGPHFHGGVADAVGFGLNPFKYVTGLAACRGLTRRDHHGTESRHRLAARGLRASADHAARQRAGGEGADRHHRLHARKTCIRNYGGRVLPALSSIVVTRPMTEAERAEAGWTTTTPSYDLLNPAALLPPAARRPLPVRRARRALGRARRPRPANSARIEAAFRRYYPDWANVEITHRWSGFVCLAMDLVPHVGAWEDEPGTYYALCYHGNGVALRLLVGPCRRAADRHRRAAGAEDAAPAAAAISAALSCRPLYLRGAYVKFGLEDAFGRWSDADHRRPVSARPPVAPA